MYELQIATLLILIVAMILDIKLKSVPSVLLSGLLLIVAVVNIDYFVFGGLALVYAWFLMDLGFIEGMADVKVLGITGFFIPNIYLFLVFLLVVVTAGFIYEWSLVYIMKIPKKTKVPFLPVLVLTFIVINYLGLTWGVYG